MKSSRLTAGAFFVEGASPVEGIEGASPVEGVEVASLVEGVEVDPSLRL
jgi:hypothetical protein